LPDPGEIAAIVLAAGTSSRFGSNKLLHPLTRHGATLPLAAHSLMPWLETFGHVTVVTRPDADTFCTALEIELGAAIFGRIRWIACAEAAQGMASSLSCGVRASPAATGWIIGLADMPAVPSSAIAGIRNALLEGANLAAPYCNGRRGHPVGFASRYHQELLKLKGDTGARQLIERDLSRIVQLNIDNEGIFTDIDIPGDLQHL